MDDGEAAVIRALRDRGFAVIYWTPEELHGADPRDVEEWGIAAGHDIINTLRTDNENDSEEENHDS